MPTLKETLQAKLENVTLIHHEAVDRKKAKLNATALMAIWRAAFQKAYPTETFFMWRTYEQSGFKKACDRGVPLAVLEEFVTFCVSDFANVIGTQLSWLKSAPKVADVTIATKFIDKFFIAFEDKADPARQLRHRIATSNVKPRPAPKVAQATDAEVDKLKAENAALKETLDVVKKTETRKRILRVRSAKKLLTHRKTGPDKEFGSWDN